jgi:hypothetical protein
VATTSLGIPKYAQTDNADIASKLNAIADQVNSLLLARSFVNAARRMVRTDTNKYTVLQDGTIRFVTGFSVALTDVGAIAYGAGVMTVPVTGLYLVSTHTVWPGATGSANYSRLVRFYVNGNVPTGNASSERYSVSAGDSARDYTTTGMLNLTAGDTVQIAIALSVAAPANEDVFVADFTVARVG